MNIYIHIYRDIYIYKYKGIYIKTYIYEYIYTHKDFDCEIDYRVREEAGS